jgi:hypothetical protein
VDYQALLDRRAQIGDEISQTIGRLGVLLGVLMRQEVELQNLLRRTAEAAGVKANAFATPTTVPDAICAELTYQTEDWCHALDR